jgi:hypothetical protein
MSAARGSRIGSGLRPESWFEIAAIGWSVGSMCVLAQQLIGNSWHLGVAGQDCRDFTWIWLSGHFAASSDPVQVYDHSAFSAARVALVGPPHCILGQFDNPPTILFYAYPLGSLPYVAGFAAWIGGTLLLYLAAIWAIVPRRVAVIAALTPYPVLINALLGHNGFLTAGLVGFALVFLERRPWLSGICLALLTYKPQFGLLFPFALLTARRWRALFAAAAASMILATSAAIAFGYRTWPAFAAALADRAASLSDDPQLNFWLISVAGFLRVAGVGPTIAWVAQFAVTAAVAVVVSILWARPVRYPPKAAALGAGSVLAAPHAFGYDACILSISAAFLLKDGLARGFLPRELLWILLSWAGLLHLRGPMPAIVSAVLIVLAIRRARHPREDPAGPPHPVGLRSQGQPI